MSYKKNPFFLGLCAPAYLAVATIAITNDFLMAVMFLLFTLGILGAYVTEFPIFPNFQIAKIKTSKMACSETPTFKPYYCRFFDSLGNRQFNPIFTNCQFFLFIIILKFSMFSTF